ncbi:MAG: type IX secretion system sortase PorU [Cyclobacteriaceae bacterium]
MILLDEGEGRGLKKFNSPFEKGGKGDFFHSFFFPVVFRWGILLQLFYGGLAPVGWAQSANIFSDGEVYQFKITTDGVYRLDYDLLREVGLDVDQLNPTTIHVYGQRGGTLPQSNFVAAPQLAPLPIYPVGLEDSVFDKDDYLLIYAEGPDRVEYDPLTAFYQVQQNPYARENFIFITIGEESPNWMTKKPSLAFGWGSPLDSYVGVYHHELSERSIVSSGREWFGEALGEDLDDEESAMVRCSLTVPALVENVIQKAQTSVVSTTGSPTQYRISVNQRLLGEISVIAAQTSLYGFRGRSTTDLHALTWEDEATTSLGLEVSPVTDGGAGYLDFVTVNAEHPLQYDGQSVRFKHPLMSIHSITQFRIQQMTDNLMVWDITDPLRPAEQRWNQNNEEGRFQVFADTTREYLLFDPQLVEDQPQFIEKIHGGSSLAEESPELLIITTPVLQKEAERLAQFRQDHDALSVQVTLLQDIYRSYSAGRQDVTAIRNYIRELYQQEGKLRYVLIFGDASYNYLSTEDNTNVIPTYQSYESLHNVHSYASDDYFGFLDPEEGEWSEATQALPHDLDVAIGRLPVNTAEEATIMVDKLIHYASNPATLGKWKQQLLFVADDGDENKHQSRSDFLASQAESRTKFHAQRLFMDAFPQEEHSAPQMRERLEQMVQRGVFLVDFIGHGGETAWTDERILDLALIDDWTNYDRLPIFLTATCEFGRYDDPRRQSGAERALLHPEGGAIAMLTTARPVFTGANFEVSSAFYEVLTQSNLSESRLGDIFRKTKNRSVSGTSNRNFTLLGDPSMALSIPQREAVITNWQAKPNLGDTLLPLQSVTLQGEVQLTDRIDAEFNGVIYLDFFAQPQTKLTLGSEDAGVLEYTDRSARLFQGKAKVKDGTFTANVRIPKNISPELGYGNIRLYAEDRKRHLDAMGRFDQFVLGGDPISAEADLTPPEIRMYLNQPGYPPTTTVYNRPTLIAELSDPSGINTLPGEHAILLSVDGDEAVEIQDWYEAKLDTYQAGRVEFTLPYLPPGNHSLILQVSDIYLNTTSQKLDFTIVDDSVFLLQAFSVYPNPTNDEVVFDFSVSKDSHPTRAEVQLLSTTGDLMAHWTESLAPDSEEAILRRSLISDAPVTVPPGIYIYQFFIYNEQNEVVTRQGKLIFR